jgi:hypothetical protein
VSLRRGDLVNYTAGLVQMHCNAVGRQTDSGTEKTA